MTATRRQFIRMLGAGTMVAPLSALLSRAAHGAPAFGPGFGPLAPQLPLNTEAVFAPGKYDYRNTPIIALPEGFRYWVMSCTGQLMSDGSYVPGDHDGMAAFRGPRGTTILVRNHELNNRQALFGDATGVAVPTALKYDSYANGGTTTLVLDESGKLLRDFASLGGTNNNCAGGLTPWGSWLTCEETTAIPNATLSTYQKRHGYVFEVPASANSPVAAVPIVGMGRFSHEATATDPATGIVYQTEDTGDSLIYRYVPNVPGNLLAGGRLQALKFRDSAASINTATGFLSRLNEPLAVEWVTIDNPDPLDNTTANSTRAQGRVKGAARFVRGEGMWYGNGLIYFVCTSGGDIGAGQVWAYNPANDTVMLLVESTHRDVLEAPDNITVGPDGRLYMYEDGANGNNIVGVNRDGELFRVAENVVNDSEFAGGCFSHNGRFMFCNIQSPGLTLVIEGPWRKGQR